jgi:hypothetical protein
MESNVERSTTKIVKPAAGESVLTDVIAGMVSMAELDSVSMEDVLNSARVLEVLRELDAESSGEESWSIESILEEPTGCAGREMIKKGKQRTGKRTRIAEPEERQQRSKHPLNPAEVYSRKILAISAHLKANHETFKKLALASIVSLVEKGLQQGIQPKLSKELDVEHSPYKCPKRVGAKRGVYKQRTRDGWTSCTLKKSATVSQNMLQTKRNPPLPFQPRLVVARDIELNLDCVRDIQAMYVCVCDLAFLESHL